MATSGPSPESKPEADQGHQVMELRAAVASESRTMNRPTSKGTFRVSELCARSHLLLSLRAEQGERR